MSGIAIRRRIGLGNILEGKIGSERSVHVIYLNYFESTNPQYERYEALASIGESTEYS